MIRKLILSLFALFVCIGTAHADAAQSAANRYSEYVAAIPNAAEMSRLNHFLSTDTLNARDQYIKRIQNKKNKSRQEVELMLLERAQHAESCVSNRQFLNSTTPNSDTVILSYRFEDKCASNPDAIIATIADVTMLKQEGAWTIDMVSPRPEKPLKIRETITPQ